MSYVVGLWQEGVYIAISLSLGFLFGIQMLRVRARRRFHRKGTMELVKDEARKHGLMLKSDFKPVSLGVGDSLHTEMIYRSPYDHWSHFFLNPFPVPVDYRLWCDWQWKDDVFVAPGFSNLPKVGIVK